MTVYDDQRTKADTDELSHITGINAEQEEAMVREATKGAAADQAAKNDEGGEDSEGEEKAPGGDSGWKFTNKSSSDDKSQKKRWLTKKKAGILGGVGGVGILGTMLLSTVSFGPLELAAAGHGLLTSFGRSNQESSNRLGELLGWQRFAKTGDIGETRVGTIGSKVFGTATSQLSDSGIDFQRFAGTGRPTGITVDQSKLTQAQNDLNLKGVPLGSDEAKLYIANQLGVSVDDLTGGENGKWQVDLKGYSQKSLRLLTKSSLKLLGDSWITTSVKSRYLKVFFDLPSLFHVFSKARAAAFQKIYLKSVSDKEKKGEPAQQAESEASTEAATEEDSANFKTSVQEPFQGEAKTAVDNVESAKNSFSSAVTKTLTFTGAACIARNTAGEIAKVNRDIVVLPAAAAAMRVISAGEGQSQSGTGGITADQAGAMVNSFYDKNGKSIFQGQAFNYLRDPTGKISGTDLPGNYQQSFNGHSTAQTLKDGADAIIGDAVGWLHIPGLSNDKAADVLCSSTSLILQAATAIVLTVGSEVLSGGFDTPQVAALWTANLVKSTVVSMVVFGAVLNLIEHVAINNQLPQQAFSGPVGGDLLAYGSRAADGISSIASGGISLGNDDTTLPDGSGDTYGYGTSPQPTSMFARIFSLHDENSLVGRLAMSYFSSDVSSGPPGIMRSLTNVGSTLQHMFASLIPSASAKAPTKYSWGFPQYGIPDDMLNDPALADPYANATTAGKALDGGDGQNYVQKALVCFGVNVKKAPDGAWDVFADHMVDTSSTDYTDADCTEHSSKGGVDPDTWRRMIMFVFDTTTAKAAACTSGKDDQSCKDLDIDNTTTNNDESGFNTTPSTTGKSLANTVGFAANAYMDPVS